MDKSISSVGRFGAVQIFQEIETPRIWNPFGEEGFINVHLCLSNVHLVCIRLRTNSLGERFKVGDQPLLVRDSYIYIYPELPGSWHRLKYRVHASQPFSSVNHLTLFESGTFETTGRKRNRAWFLGGAALQAYRSLQSGGPFPSIPSLTHAMHGFYHPPQLLCSSHFAAKDVKENMFSSRTSSFDSVSTYATFRALKRHGLKSGPVSMVPSADMPMSQHLVPHPDFSARQEKPSRTDYTRQWSRSRFRSANRLS